MDETLTNLKSRIFFQSGSRKPQQINSPDISQRQNLRVPVNGKRETIHFSETNSYRIVPETSKLMEWRRKSYQEAKVKNWQVGRRNVKLEVIISIHKPSENSSMRRYGGHTHRKDAHM